MGSAVQGRARRAAGGGRAAACPSGSAAARASRPATRPPADARTGAMKSWRVPPNHQPPTGCDGRREGWARRLAGGAAAAGAQSRPTPESCRWRAARKEEGGDGEERRSGFLGWNVGGGGQRGFFESSRGFVFWTVAAPQCAPGLFGPRCEQQRRGSQGDIRYRPGRHAVRTAASNSRNRQLTSTGHGRSGPTTSSLFSVWWVLCGSRGWLAAMRWAQWATVPSPQPMSCTMTDH